MTLGFYERENLPFFIREKMSPIPFTPSTSMLALEDMRIRLLTTSVVRLDWGVAPGKEGLEV